MSSAVAVDYLGIATDLARAQAEELLVANLREAQAALARVPLHLRATLETRRVEKAMGVLRAYYVRAGYTLTAANHLMCAKAMEQLEDRR